MRIDTSTGVQVSIPEHLVGAGAPSRNGWNWRTHDNRLNIDVLNFGERSLRDLNATLSRIAGRRVIRRNLTSSELVLEGRDSDGTLFVVRIERQNGQSRGLSVVYSDWAAREIAPVVAEIVRSFIAFPSSTPSETSSASPPTTPQRSPEFDSKIRELEQKLAELSQKSIREQEESARREVERRKAEAIDRELKAQRERELKESEARNAEIRDRARQGPVASVLPSARLAFVVGIDAYNALPVLNRAVNDAMAVSQALRKIGFDVIEAINVDRENFLSKFYEFRSKIEAGGVAAVFFAGHGVQLAGQNYLMPKDSPGLNVVPDVLRHQAISFDTLRRELEAQRPGVTLFVLDACRNNPYVSPLASRGLPSAPRGLAPVEATSGTFVMFSAASGEEALDSLATDPPFEKNSLYTRHLVALISEGRLSLQSMAQHLREMVGTAAKKVSHRQTPAYFDGLVGTVCLLKKDCQAVAAQQ